MKPLSTSRQIQEKISQTIKNGAFTKRALNRKIFGPTNKNALNNFLLQKNSGIKTRIALEDLMALLKSIGLNLFLEDKLPTPDVEKDLEFEQFVRRYRIIWKSLDEETRKKIISAFDKNGA